MQTDTKNDKKEAIAEIIQGLFYLSRTAENAELSSVRNLLVTAIDDVAGWADNTTNDSEQSISSSIVTNSSFIAAIEFLSKFASIGDSALKDEIIREIRKSV